MPVHQVIGRKTPCLHEAHKFTGGHGGQADGHRVLVSLQFSQSPPSSPSMESNFTGGQQTAGQSSRLPESVGRSWPEVKMSYRLLQAIRQSSCHDISHTRTASGLRQKDFHRQGRTPLLKLQDATAEPTPRNTTTRKSNDTSQVSGMTFTRHSMPLPNQARHMPEASL